MIVSQGHNITVDGNVRYYELDTPSNLFQSLGSGYPLVVILHGSAAGPADVRWESRFNELQALNGEFIAAYPRGWPAPTGLPYTWADGRNYASGAAPTINDVNFIDAMITEIQGLHTIDADHIYVCGYSNGAYMTTRLMQQLRTRFAAFGVLCGHRRPTDFLSAPPSPCPIIQFSGVQDLFVKYLGGTPIVPGAYQTPALPSVAVTRAAWTAFNGISSTPTFSHRFGDALLQQYAPDGDPGQYNLWSVDNAGHNWPGGNLEPGIPSLGSQNQDIWAAQEMWRFFKLHSA